MNKLFIFKNKTEKIMHNYQPLRMVENVNNKEFTDGSHFQRTVFRPGSLHSRLLAGKANSPVFTGIVFATLSFTPTFNTDVFMAAGKKH